ncbi:S-layer homology domain-containing protein [uncultured Selenomonas sp.]|uniref:S-layer homology domain-containing protein n=1 Tax=uncultured Selenomonas sp. TaxID=159275 RepID=UPI0025D98A69|nr:S-layer homology domain-containing protein [uncultured Selenomonas sp.]
MQKRKRILTTLAIMTFALSSTASAAQNPFSDVPENHWAYDAVAQLAKDGIIEGYGDATFQGGRSITRYEMAQMVAKAMAKKEVPAADKAELDKLAAEFGDELASLGVRVANLEKHSDNVKWSGGFAQKYMRDMHKGPTGDKADPYWEKEFWLNADAEVPGSGFTAHLAIDNKWGASKWNDEEAYDEEWIGGSTRSSGFRLDKIYVEGPLGKTGQTLKFGDFQPWVQNGFVNDANLKGVEFEHWGSKFATHVFGGRLDAKVWDMAMDAEVKDIDGFSEGWLADQASGVQSALKSALGISDGDAKKIWVKSAGQAQTYNNWTDKTRYVPTSKRSTVEAYRASGDYDYSSIDFDKNLGETEENVDNLGGDRRNISGNKQRMDYYGAVVDYTYSKKLDGSLGWYHFRSAAYDHDWLDIGAALVNYRIDHNWMLNGIYAHGNQHGHDNAWNLELRYRGNPGIPSDRPGLFGCYLAYRYLGPDALVKTNLSDGIGQGQKGWEVGMFYNLTANCQFSLKYGRGKSITNPVHSDRAKVYSCIAWSF